MTNTYQQPQQSRYYGALPDLNPNSGGDFVMPEDGWNELVFKIVREADGQGNLIPVVRDKFYNGQPKPGQFDIRIEFHANDPDSEITPWKKWVGWTIGEKSNLRPILLAIRNNTPFPEGQQLNLAFLEQHESKPFRAFIAVVEKPSPTNPQELRQYANFAKLEPVKAKRAKAAPKPAPAAEPWDAATVDDDTFPDIPE